LNKETLILAHRGAKGLVNTENSFEAFDKTLEVGGEWVELDVRKSKDRKLIVFHDREIDGISIDKLCLKSIKTRKPEVVELKDVFIRYRGKLKYDIELKEDGYEEEVIKLIKDNLNYDQYFISSFSDKALIKVKSLDKRIKTGLLLGRNKKILEILKTIFPERRIKRTKADFIIAHHSVLKIFFLKRMKRLKRPVFVWTVNAHEQIEKFKKLKVRGIITDRPDIALRRCTGE